ncbi:MAG: hypothetical protein R2874_08655 [Desulfobacterales bacterium]
MEFKATGRDANGGYAEYMTVPENFAYAIPETFSDVQAAPLLCAGAIGYRSSESHRHQRRRDPRSYRIWRIRPPGAENGPLSVSGVRVFVFARNKRAGICQILGAVWAGATEETSPEPLNAIIDTTPAWKPVVEAMKNLDRGGRLVINAIRKESTDQKLSSQAPLPRPPLDGKEIKSVANVTSRDVFEFIQLAAEMNVTPEAENTARRSPIRPLLELKAGNVRGQSTADCIKSLQAEKLTNISGNGKKQ